jgi:serine/threonine-protein kinase
MSKVEPIPVASASEPEPARDPLLGTVLSDRYRIERMIGSGGMARIYEAVHQVIHRTVAVKVLMPEIAADATLVRRFVNEGRAAGMIGHPNIVEALDMGTTPDGLPFLVLEYLVGTPLNDELYRCGALPFERAAYIGIQAAWALAAAHGLGIVHRDTKPENIFLIRRDGRDDHVKVLDFGVSQFRGLEGTGEETVRGSLLGTPEYMSPEQIGGHDEVDARTDVYALGMLLYEMIGGRSAFAGRRSTVDVFRAVLTEAPMPLLERRPDTPPELAEIVMRALAKDKRERWPSAGELAAALEPFAELDERPSGLFAESLALAQRPAAARATPAFAKDGDTVAASASAPALAASAASAASGVRATPRREASSDAPGRAARISAAPTVVTPMVPDPFGSLRPSTPETSSAPTVPPAAHRPWGLALFGALALLCAVAYVRLAPRRAEGLSAAPGTPSAPSATPSPGPIEVQLVVRANAPGATAIVRGRTYALPSAWPLPTRTSPELIAIAAPGHRTVVYRVSLDRPRVLVATLPLGDGSGGATEDEIAVALGESTPTAPGTPTPQPPPPVAAAPARPLPTAPTAPAATAPPRPTATSRASANATNATSATSATSATTKAGPTGLPIFHER